MFCMAVRHAAWGRVARRRWKRGIEQLARSLILQLSKDETRGGFARRLVDRAELPWDLFVIRPVHVGQTLSLAPRSEVGQAAGGMTLCSPGGLLALACGGAGVMSGAAVGGVKGAAVGAVVGALTDARCCWQRRDPSGGSSNPASSPKKVDR